MVQYTIHGKKIEDIDDNCFPKRCVDGPKSGSTKRRWLTRVLSYYRLLKTDDPESFYMKMGPTGLKHTKNAQAIGPPAVEYEL